jgi:sugar lactone lactonase YvrE
MRRGVAGACALLAVLASGCRVVTVAGGGTAPPTDGAVATAVQLANPSNVVVYPGGGFVFHNLGLYRVDSAGTVHALAPSTGVAYSQPGVDRAGDVYVGTADVIPGAPPEPGRIERVTPDGQVTDFAQNLSFVPEYVTVGGDGAVYAAAYLGRIYKVTSTSVTSLAGTEFNNGAFAVNAAGTIFFTDGAQIMTRTSDGTVTWIGGDGTAPHFGGDGGPAKAAGLAFVSAVDIAPDGSVFLADTGNNRIRKIDTKGIITTVAGDGTAGFSGDGGDPTKAELSSPQGVAVKDANDFFVADTGNGRIRFVGPGTP